MTSFNGGAALHLVQAIIFLLIISLYSNYSNESITVFTPDALLVSRLMACGTNT